MTGVELAQLFKQGIDEPYTGYYDDTKLNRLFKEAIIQRVQEIYNNRLNNQNAFDEIGFLIAVNKEFTPSSGVLFYRPIPVLSFIGTGVTTTITLATESYLAVSNTVELSGLDPSLDGTVTVASVSGTTIVVNSPFIGSGNTGVVIPSFCIKDYEHYLWGEATFEKALEERVTSTSTTPVFVRMDMVTELRDYDYVRLAGGLVGYAYVKQHNEMMIELYTDPKLTVQYVSNVAYTSGMVYRVMTSALKFKRSDEKGGSYGVPSYENPYFQQGENIIYISPEPETVKLDYIKKLPFDIDVADDENDLERYYPYYFLMGVVDTAVKMAGFQMRDFNLVQGSQEQIVNNP